MIRGTRRGLARGTAAVATGVLVAGTMGLASTATATSVSPAVRSASTTSTTSSRVGAGQRVVEVPISFRVRNVNRSLVTCASDGRSYTVRGHLVAPVGQVGRPVGDAVALYLHGLSFGQFFWRFHGVPGYDYAAQQARRGHVSVVVDRLGYGASGTPNGFRICVGSRADMAHQMVERLRSGHYRLGHGRPTTAYRKVALLGHSYGGQIVQVEAYSFGDIDALGVVAYSDRVQSALLRRNAAYAAAVCARGGQPVAPGGPGGYASFGPPAGAPAALFNSAAPRVEAAVLKRLTLDPCGDGASFPAAVKVDLARVRTVHVPVLVVTGGADALFPRPAGRDQAALFTGAPSVTQVTFPGSGHAITFERTHRRFVRVVDRWLRRTLR